jgi:hypothetical protein
MNEEFAIRIQKIPALFSSLCSQPFTQLSGKSYPDKPAIYVFFENENPLHVGRTRNLKQRLKGHVTKSHYKATFAFKETRRLTNNEKATYKTIGSRSSLMTNAAFAEIFGQQIERVGKLSIKYLVVDDPIDQYLLELYAAIEYKTSLTEFDTH